MKKADNKFKKSGLIVVIILSTIFGLSAGVVGELLTRVYILENNYNIPFFGEINFSDSNYNGSNLIIRDARKVIVEQNTKVTETINSVNSSLIGVFKKKTLPTVNDKSMETDNKTVPKELNIDNYYRLNQEIGQGLIISSDGWIVTNSFIEEANPQNAINDYVVITKDKKVYNIENFVQDPISSFSFIRVSGAKDLPVKQFAQDSEIKNGQLVIALNWEGYNLLSSIIFRQENSEILKFSDIMTDELVLANNLNEDFSSSIIFNLAGQVVGLVDRQEKIIPISYLQSAIRSLFKNKDIKRPSLGVNYLDLSSLAAVKNNLPKGALIYKNINGLDVIKDSPADRAGLKAGDIITFIDNIEIDKDNSLNYIIQNYLAGDKINIVYQRNGEIKEVEVILGEVKK